MASQRLKFNTAASTNLQRVGSAGTCPNLKGIEVWCTAAYSIFVKFYWFQPNAGTDTPTVGTTSPDLTVGCATLAAAYRSWPDGIRAKGELWVAVTKLAADSDTTATVAGDGIVTVLFEN